MCNWRWSGCRCRSTYVGVEMQLEYHCERSQQQSNSPTVCPQSGFHFSHTRQLKMLTWSGHDRTQGVDREGRRVYHQLCYLYELQATHILSTHCSEFLACPMLCYAMLCAPFPFPLSTFHLLGIQCGAPPPPAPAFHSLVIVVLSYFCTSFVLSVVAVIWIVGFATQFPILIFMPRV